MPVIAVSGDPYCDRGILAQLLSERLGCRRVQNEDILQRAAARGVPYTELKDALEKPPGFLDHVVARRCARLTSLKAALLEELRDGDAVYYDSTGHMLCDPVPQVLRVRLVASPEARIRAAQNRERLTHAQAAARVEKSDREERRWAHFLYGSKADDETHYDIAANVETTMFDQISKMVASTIEQDRFRPTSADQQQLADLALAARVHAELAEHVWAFAENLKVFAHTGIVTICGQVSTERDVEDVRAIAESLPGVLGIELRLVAEASGLDGAVCPAPILPLPPPYSTPSSVTRVNTPEWEPVQDFERGLEQNFTDGTAIEPEHFSIVKVEKLIGWTLLIGVLASTLLVFTGGIVHVDRHAEEVAHYRTFRSEPPDLRQLGGIWRDVEALSGRGLIQLGLMLLVGLQVLRVLLTGALFLRIRDRLFVVISIVVLALLAYGLFIESAT